MLSRPEIRGFQVSKVALDEQICAQAAPECIALGTVEGGPVALKCVQTCHTVPRNSSGAGYSQNRDSQPDAVGFAEYLPKQRAGFHGIFIPG